MVRRVPQRRNGGAGVYTGRSESARYFASHPEARRKKNEYNREYHGSEERKRYRAELNRENRTHHDGKDSSHTRDGRIVREDRSRNRARNGKNGKSSKK
jgi:hypothetical protein